MDRGAAGLECAGGLELAVLEQSERLDMLHA